MRGWRAPPSLRPVSGSAVTLPRRAPATAHGADVSRRSALGATAWALAACVALAALTLIAPSQPTYDPWAWIIWGRELAHLDLSTTFGPSFKPLPVALTALLSPFGDAAPTLWVLVARAGALAGALFAFRLGRRLGGSAAGAAAAVALLLAPWYLRNGLLANSEGLQVAFALAAVEQALAGRRTTAFWLALGLGLLRPEAWPFVGLYGAWLVWRRRARLVTIGAGLASLPLLWLVPERLGSGDWLRAAHRAQDPVSGSAAEAASPVWQVLHEGWEMLSSPLRWALAASLLVVVARRDGRLLALTGLTGAWALLVALMTANGYSGNSRYLVVPAALAIVVAAAALSGALRAAAERLGAPRALAAAASATMALAFASAWLGPARRTVAAASWQARMTEQLGPLVDRAGGPARLLGCGPVATGAYLVPAVAWELGVHMSDVRLVAERPGTVLRVHTTQGTAAAPTLTPLAGAPLRTLGVSADWRILQTCGARR